MPVPGAGGGQADGEAMAIGLEARDSGVTCGGVYYTVEQFEIYRQIKSKHNLPDGSAHLSALLPLIASGEIKLAGS